MRDFLQERVLLNALPWATLFTVMSLPRIAQGPFASPLWPWVAFAFCVLMLATGTVFAWGTKGGLAGFIPGAFWNTRTIAHVSLLGVIVAVLLAVSDIPRRLLLQDHPNEFLEELAYPEQFADWAIMLSWNLSFMTVFFTCAAMALFSRVTRRWVVALIIVVSLRWFSSLYRLSSYDLIALWPVTTVTTLIFAVPSCWLYARHGYPAVALFTTLTTSRHLFRDDFEGPF